LEAAVGTQTDNYVGSTAFDGRAALDADPGRVRFQELKKDAGKMKFRKACGVDDLPAEFRKSWSDEKSETAKWAVKFRNRCRQDQLFPKSGTKRKWLPFSQAERTAVAGTVARFSRRSWVANGSLMYSWTV
jgi:hypothetical protein